MSRNGASRMSRSISYSYAKVPGGYLILVGRVEHTQMIAPEIHSAVYFHRTFHRLPSNRTELGT
jgi:hypothetical protein